MPDSRLPSTAIVRRRWHEGSRCFVEVTFSAATQENLAGPVTVALEVDAALFAQLGKGALVKVSFDPHHLADARIESVLKPVSH
jgi:hypothetical protein